MNECDFCSEGVSDDDPRALVYPAVDFASTELQFKSAGGWLACPTCVAFIRQYDLGERDARNNLARRSLEKLRRKYDIRGAADSKEVTAILLIEITQLHDAFWEYRRGEPVPYTRKALEERR